MKTKLTINMLFAGLLLIVGCGGSVGGATGGDTATTREVIGTLDLSAPASAVKMATEGASCSIADQVIATNTLGVSITEAIASDCSFSLALGIDTSYVVSFTLADVFVATLLFDSGSGTDSDIFKVTSSDTAIDLGVITIAGEIASPELNPLDQCDDDDDGESDYDDSDDDQDGINDDAEEDCDDDGYINDVDVSDSSCDSEDHGDNSGSNDDEDDSEDNESEDD